MDNISLSVRPLKKGLFLKIGKYFFKIIPPVGNQTYMLQLLYYIFYRNPSCILLTEDGNTKKNLRVKGEYSNG